MIPNAPLFSSPFILAPLAGYTDAPFRHIAHEWGSGGAVTEMISAEGLARDSRNTEALLARYDGEKPLVAQLFGPSLDPFMRCVDRLMEYAPDMIDINCGCPVAKVVKTGAGSALMRRPDEIHRIVDHLVRNTPCPVSVKFRLGWDSSSLNYMEVASAAADAGAWMLTLHARTRSQGYSGKADWSHIARLKEHMRGTDVKIFASGDIFSAQDAVDVMDRTGCDGVMIARGAMGNPFIFTQAARLQERRGWQVSLKERKTTMLRHLDYMVQAFGDDVAMRDMRKHAVHYVKGLRGAGQAKAMINVARSREDYERALDMLDDEGAVPQVENTFEF